MRSKILLLLFLFQSTILFSENWPSWRGPGRNGISSEKGLPMKWSKTENVAWRLPLPGPAAATPVVWENRIFLTSLEGSDLVLMCVGTDGKLIWKKKVSSGNADAKGDEGNFAAPSPTTDGKNVFVFFGSGDLASYDFNGNEIWKTNLQKNYGQFQLNFVMSSSPLLDGNRLYLQLLHSNRQWVLAFDKANGKEVWRHIRATDARDECRHSYASPVIYREGKTEYLLIHGADYITAHKLTDGAEIWRSGGFNPKDSYNPALRFVSSPIAADGMIIAPSAKNGPVQAIKPDSKGDISSSKTQYHWILPQGTPDVPSPLLYDNILYLNRENGDLLCIDAKTGKQLYLEHTHRSRHRGSPVYADGKVYVTSRDGIVSVVQAGPKFQLLAQNDLGEPQSASPAISNGVIYLRTYQALYAIKAAK